MKQQIIFPKSDNSFECLGHIKIIGPLTMDSRKNRVYIVPGVKLKLNQNEFEVLTMLAARENTSLSFEWLYSAIWDQSDGTDYRKEALKSIESVVNIINEKGGGFVWIDRDDTPLSYTFRSKWGHNISEWQSA